MKNIIERMIVMTKTPTSNDLIAESLPVLVKQLRILKRMLGILYSCADVTAVQNFKYSLAQAICRESNGIKQDSEDVQLVGHLYLIRSNDQLNKIKKDLAVAIADTKYVIHQHTNKGVRDD